MKRVLLPLAACGLLLGCSDRSSSPLAPNAALNSAAASTQNAVFQTSFQVFVPCAVGGAGELIQVSGPLHVLFHTTIDGAGRAHVRAHFQPQGISGAGLTTGDSYQGNGVTQNEFNVTRGTETTFVNRFQMIGQGPGNNFAIRETAHVTIDANGTVTARFDNYSVECR